MVVIQDLSSLMLKNSGLKAVDAAMQPGRTTRTIAPLSLAGLLVLVLAGWWLLFSGRVEPSGATASPLPSGVTTTSAAAIAEARSHVSADARLLGTQLSHYSDATLPPGFAPEGASLDKMVWVVNFESMFSDICNPDHVCLSPRPGTSAVVIDASTGSWITTYAYSAP